MKIHENNGKCLGCQKKFDEHPGFNKQLREWFEKLQTEIPSAHISCAWRGKSEQENLWLRRATRARWPKSSHAYGLSFDLFCNDGTNLYPMDWFDKIISPRIPPYITWYGAPGSKFFELCHFEIKDWEKIASEKCLKPLD